MDSIELKKCCIMCALCLSLFMMVFSPFFMEKPVWSADAVVVKGEGFHITVQDVQDLRSFFADRSFYTTDQEYIKGAIRLRLFTQEAIAMKLVPEESEINLKSPSIEDQMHMSQIYMEKVLNEYPISSTVIESYYRSYPDKFRDERDAESDNIRPLDILVSEEIVRHIRGVKKADISAEKMHELMKKYNVHILTTPEDKQG